MWHDSDKKSTSTFRRACFGLMQIQLYVAHELFRPFGEWEHYKWVANKNMTSIYLEMTKVAAE